MKIIKFILIIIFAFSAGCKDFVVNEPDVNNNLSDYEAVYSIIKNRYPFLSFKKINWDSLYFKYLPEASKSKGDEIYMVLYDLLRELKDGHVELKVKGGFGILTYGDILNKNSKTFDPLVVRRYFTRELKLTGENLIAYEFLDNNLGYVHFSTFNDGEWINDFNKVLEYFADSKGLIIDVRNNGGGNNNITDFIISRLTENQIQYSIYNKNFEQVINIFPVKYPRYLKPVVVLINGASFSAAELFPEISRQLPNVILIGDTTGGGGGSNDIFELPSGKGIKMPIGYFTRLDGSMVEWNGILPDIVIEQTEADIKNKQDKQLEYAINYLR